MAAEDSGMSSEDADATPRKRRVPKQGRSINTVESILQAAEELFLKDGFDKTTVEDIVQRAGIATGSFYDYFPNKTAMALALLESVSTEIAGDARKYFMEFGRETIEESLPKVVRRIFHRYKRHKNILINLVNEVPELRATAENYSVDRLIYRASLIYLQIYQDDFGGKDLRLVHGIMNLVYSSAIKTYLSDAHPPFEEGVFLDQLSAMMLGYLAYDDRRQPGSATE